MTTTDSQLVSHLVDQKYIKDAADADTFLSCCHPDFLDQLMDDSTYELEL